MPRWGWSHRWGSDSLWTPWKINGWNLQPSPIWKGIWSEPNLHDYVMFQPLIFRGVCDVTWDGDLKKVKELSSLQLYGLYRVLGRLWIGSHDVWSICTKKIAFRCNDRHVDSLGSIRRLISKKTLGTHLGWCRTLWEHVGTIPDRQVDLGIL